MLFSASGWKDKGRWHPCDWEIYAERADIDAALDHSFLFNGFTAPMQLIAKIKEKTYIEKLKRAGLSQVFF